MENKGERTKERILQTAEKIILGKGFSGTSIEEIIAESEITKGGFFYHFNGKNDLAVSLVRRYLAQDEAIFQSIFTRADALSEDSLQRLLIALNLFAEAMGNLPGAHPGCLVATFTYESQICDPEIRELIAGGVKRWRQIFKEKLDAAKADHKPKVDFDTEQVADMFTAIIEGGIILSRSLQDPAALPNQVLHYRNYVRFLFS